jgi:uncharacterized protein (DUF4415 family)
MNSDNKDVIIEITEADYQEQLAEGVEEEYALKPGRHVFRRGGFLERHPDFDPKKVEIKVHVEIELDLEVLNYFKQRAAEPNAPSYETQISRVLREYVERATRASDAPQPPPERDYAWLLNDPGFIEAVAERLRQRA